MNKISFVLYAKQMMSLTYLGGLPSKRTKELETSLTQLLSDTYDVNFKWEEAIKEHTADALVLPDPFPPILNESQTPVIKIPATLFIQGNTKEIKQHIDDYFAE